MDLVQIVSQVGFPIGVAMYSLIVLNKTIETNTDMMKKIAYKLGIYEEEKK